jgi:hypothetical protein
MSARRTQAAVHHKRKYRRLRAPATKCFKGLQRFLQALLAKEELRSIVKAWNDSVALDAFFNELSRRAQALVGNERADFEARIHTARALAGARMRSSKPMSCGGRL